MLEPMVRTILTDIKRIRTVTESNLSEQQVDDTEIAPKATVFSVVHEKASQT